MSTPLPRTLDLIEQGMAAGLHVGAQVYAAVGGRPAADVAVGAARPGVPAGVPMTAETVMLWLSASKPFAAVALAQFRERGRVDWDDPVAATIPEFAAHGKGDITLRHVLTHTAPLRTVETGWPAAAWDEIIARLCDARPEPDWPPGEKAGYSPFATWFLLGEVVRRLDGRTYAEYVRDEVFLPLGMTDSWLAMPPAVYQDYGDRIGVMVNTARRPPVPAGDDTEQAAAASRPSGGGRGPAHDLGRFYQMLLNGGELAGRRVLSAESVRDLTARHRVGMFDQTFRHVMDWGLGFIPNNARYGPGTVPYGYGPHASADAFGHSGSQSSAAFADPARGLAAVVVFNGMPGEPAHQRRIRPVLAALYEDLGLV